MERLGLSPAFFWRLSALFTERTVPLASHSLPDKFQIRTYPSKISLCRKACSKEGCIFMSGSSLSRSPNGRFHLTSATGSVLAVTQPAVNCLLLHHSQSRQSALFPFLETGWDIKPFLW